MLLLDSSALVELERELSERRVGRVRAFLGRHAGEDVACSAVTVGELASGESEAAVRILLRNLRTIAISEAVAYRAGALDRELAETGRRLGENDNWIAATALLYSATLVYSDGDFDRVGGLKRAKLTG